MGRSTTRRKPGDLPNISSIKLSGKKVWVWVILYFSPIFSIKNVLLNEQQNLSY